MIAQRKKHRVKRLHGDRFQCATCGQIVTRDRAFIVSEKDQLCTCLKCVEQGEQSKEVHHV